jgi:hypothetical protein
VGKIASPVAAPGVTPAAANTNQPVNAGVVPFRRATLRKVEQSTQTTLTLGTTPILLNRVLESTGFLCEVGIEVLATTAGNAAAVAYAADAPWSALQQVVLKDVGPDVVCIWPTCTVATATVTRLCRWTPTFISCWRASVGASVARSARRSSCRWPSIRAR